MFVISLSPIQFDGKSIIIASKNENVPNFVYIPLKITKDIDFQYFGVKKFG